MPDLPVIGPYGPCELNVNGEQLLDFCAGHDLIVSITLGSSINPVTNSPSITMVTSRKVVT